MSYKRATETTQVHLENQSLPNHGKSYTVISHKQVIDNTKILLNDSGFTIRKELYRANLNAQVAQGVYHIYPTQCNDDEINNETELGMMFAWTNSYDKSTRFQCAIGAYVKVSNNGMIAGDMMNFKRKHVGSADYDMIMQLSNQIKNGEKYYKRIIKDKNSLKNTVLTKREQSELLGRLFADEEIISSNQINCIKKEMTKPSYDYNCDQDNAWVFYNHVTHSLKISQPKNWMQDSQDFHDFMMTKVVKNSTTNSLKDVDFNNLKTTIDETFNVAEIKDIIAEKEGAIEIDEDITPSQLIYDLYTS